MTHEVCIAARAADDELWSSQQWCSYFRRNRAALLDIPWERGACVAPQERAAIAESVREFQLGESAEGRHFVAAARAYAARTGDVEYVNAVRLLIAEEQRHARDLAHFLDLASIPLARRCWADSIFRWLRKRAGLEVCVAVLVTAEMIAKVYYAALRDATASPVLRRLCEQILSDEVAHVRFQCERLAILRTRRPRAIIALLNQVHRIMLSAACIIVWRKHARAMRAGGYGFARFWRAACAEMHQAKVQMTSPRRRRVATRARTRVIEKRSVAPAANQPDDFHKNNSAQTMRPR